MTEPAPHRIAKPTPLILHLGQAAAITAGAVSAAPLAQDDRMPWVADLQAAAQTLPQLDQASVGLAAAGRLTQMLKGITSWQCHPYRREPHKLPEIWSDGTCRLLDYGGSGTVVLVIPSMINRSYVLDLMPDRSLMQALRDGGFRPLLLDWGTPAGAELTLSISDQIHSRLRPALAIARVLAGGPVPVIGYCMGGTLAVALAQLAPRDLSALVTIGAPWNFAERPWVSSALSKISNPSQLRAQIQAMGQAFGAVPDDIFQSLFAMLDPALALRKFRTFAALDPSNAEAERFVALEDWINDGTPIGAKVAEEVLIDWYLENHPGRGQWHIGQTRIDPRQISVPALCICAQRDKIAPPGSTQALAALLPKATLVKPTAGHVGMIVGRKAATETFFPIIEFLTHLEN